jgi:hypothetical protein
LSQKDDPDWGLVALPKRPSLPLARRIAVDGLEIDRLNLYQYANDPFIAPRGGVVIVVQYEAYCDRWKALRGDEGAYGMRKPASLPRLCEPSRNAVKKNALAIMTAAMSPEAVKSGET